MIIIIIAAMSRNRVIGRGGGIPWQLPEDLRRFRELTTGHTVIMGRRTFETIGHPLPHRRNIVITRQPGYAAAGCIMAGSLEEALRLAGQEQEVFICGGGEIYRQALPLAQRIYLTQLDCTVAGDTLFPPVPAAFTETAREELNTSPPAVFITLDRRA
jgi:dihydrofolate reductase